jgi:glycosyltransferase involved in cell wall biosynthesis
MRKICIVITYYNRELQLTETIKSIGKSKHDNYELIVVDDCSDLDLDEQYLKTFLPKSCGLHIVKIEKTFKDWNNPVIVYNIGIIKALEFSPEIIVFQNAEAYHFGDILSHANENINDDNYYSYGCFSVDHNLTINNIGRFEEILPELLLTNTSAPLIDCDISWYNHPVYRPVGYDFCSAISTNNMIKLNGFDERYAKCIWYGDDDFKLRVDRLGLPVKITKYPEEPIVVHQWHEHSYIDQSLAPQQKMNGYNILTQVKTFDVNNYKAKHIISKNFNEL